MQCTKILVKTKTADSQIINFKSANLRSFFSYLVKTN